VTVMVRHFRCLQEKEARQTAQKARSKRQKEKEREREEERGLGVGLGSDRPGWSGRASMFISESDHR
jgi:hypothetical protein